jgi:hypothetical protein
LLGDVISETKGKITGKRVLEVSASGAPRIEISQSCEGKIKGNIDCTELWTYWAEHGSDGAHYGKGVGVLMSKDGDVVSIRGQGIGIMTESGGIRYVGSNFYSTISKGELAFLNNLVAVIEYDVEEDGSYTGKTWEWK